MPDNRRATPESLRRLGDRVRTQIADLVAAYRAADLQAMLSYFAPDVVFMPADRPAARGVAAIRRYFERNFANGVELIALHSDGFVSAEEVAVQRGTYTQRIAHADGEPTEERGSYELTWRLQDDGQYRVTSWIFTRGDYAPKGPHRF
jgi:uncharacterized protein (TIGR02246 family)